MMNTVVDLYFQLFAAIARFFFLGGCGLKVEVNVHAIAGVHAYSRA